MGQDWAYDRLNRVVRDGLLEQKTLLHRQPSLYIATAEGLPGPFRSASASTA
jgi:hypothetical protein